MSYKGILYILIREVYFVMNIILLTKGTTPCECAENVPPKLYHMELLTLITQEM